VEKDEKGVFAKAAYDHLLSLGPCYAGIVSEASVLKRLPPHSAEQIRGEVREALVEWRKIVKANNGNKVVLIATMELLLSLTKCLE